MTSFGTPSRENDELRVRPATRPLPLRRPTPRFAAESSSSVVELVGPSPLAVDVARSALSHDADEWNRADPLAPPAEPPLEPASDRPTSPSCECARAPCAPADAVELKNWAKC